MELSEFSALTLAVLVIVTVFGGLVSGTLLATVIRLSSNKDTLRVLENYFEKGDPHTQEAIKLAHRVMTIAEALANQTIPNTELAKAIDAVEDFTGELTDGVPVDTQPLTATPAHAVQSHEIGSVG